MHGHPPDLTLVALFVLLAVFIFVAFWLGGIPGRIS